MEELPPTNADFVIAQSAQNGLSAIEKQNIDDIVSMDLQKQADLYNRKMQLLEETIQNLQMEHEPKKMPFFNHIQLLWGLIEQNLVPEAVNPQVFKRFQARFSSIDELEAHASEPNANVFAADADIEALNAGCAGRVKILQGMLQLEESDLHYIHGKEFAEKTLKSYGLDEEEVNSEGDNVDEQDEENFEGVVIDLQAPSDGDKDSEYVKDGEWSHLYDEDEDEDYVQSSEEKSDTEEEKEEFADKMGEEERMEE
ncbi:hypothetical protein O181_013434 [Austropuccinia psidii MF-1]|uniref:Uncharacterized protein n=1 Tax=Austropuccinia psidii MF-1 TaxID=1389203 RepID=A0A9Q3BY82_9BASI|nr:hypothetical protein [Austropuccinia psidii MF-1]